jgi:hypothetical protein
VVPLDAPASGAVSPYRQPPAGRSLADGRPVGQPDGGRTCLLVAG